jgi:hypothetical protein
MSPQDVPSLSAGLLFHHYAHPFSDAVALAFAQLKSAKHDTNGRHPAVTFLDLTADGAHRPAHRQVCTRDWLAEHADVLGALAATPTSHRATLIEQHRGLNLVGRYRRTSEPGQRRRPGGAATDPSSFEAETLEQAFARKVIDRSDPAVLAAARDAAADPRLEGEDLRRVLEDDHQVRDRLRHLLDLARWWPPDTPAADAGRQP